MINRYRFTDHTHTREANDNGFGRAATHTHNSGGRGGWCATHTHPPTTANVWEQRISTPIDDTRDSYATAVPISIFPQLLRYWKTFNNGMKLHYIPYVVFLPSSLTILCSSWSIWFSLFSLVFVCHRHVFVVFVLAQSYMHVPVVT